MLRTKAAVLGVGFIALATSPTFGASGPPPFVTGQPVQVIVTNPTTAPAPTIVTNPATMPALTSSVDDPGRNPYQVSADKNCGGLGCNIDFPAVPDGHRLVVQQVSCSGSYQGANPPYVAVSVEKNAVPTVRSSFFAPYSGGQILFRQPLTYYLNEKVTLDIGFYLGGTATIGQTQCSLTGYLVDCTANLCSPIVEQ
jgi:hypothetical protein